MMRVVVVLKRTAIDTFLGRGATSAVKKRVERLLRARSVSVERMRAAHVAHEKTVEHARRLLAKLGCAATFVSRNDKFSVRSVDLVVSLGGDGTLLAASHRVPANLPILAINTAPRDSVGYFCAGTSEDLEETLVRALEGRLAALTLTRMNVAVDDVSIDTRVLNDILFCHAVPAETSRYVLRSSESGTQETQKSSGIWAGPAAGSTAAQRSAGGRVLPLSASELQFVVREPYTPPGQRYAMTRGLVARGESLSITSKMAEARIYLDGPRLVRMVEMGARVTLSASKEPLTILGMSSRAIRSRPASQPRPRD